MWRNIIKNTLFGLIIISLVILGFKKFNSNENFTNDLSNNNSPFPSNKKGNKTFKQPQILFSLMAWGILVVRIAKLRLTQYR